MVFSACNARPHVAQYNADDLDSKVEEFKPKFKVFMWPSPSPDLKPIENLWSYVKKKLETYGQRLKVPTSKNSKSAMFHSLVLMIKQSKNGQR